MKVAITSLLQMWTKLEGNKFVNSTGTIKKCLFNEEK